MKTSANYATENRRRANRHTGTNKFGAGEVGGVGEVFRFRKTNPDIAKLLEVTEKAKGLIEELHRTDPLNPTFDQVGILDGRENITEYLEHNEWGVAFEHLLYMIHESGIAFPENELLELHSIAKLNGPHNRSEES